MRVGIASQGQCTCEDIEVDNFPYVVEGSYFLIVHPPQGDFEYYVCVRCKNFSVHAKRGTIAKGEYTYIGKYITAQQDGKMVIVGYVTGKDDE